MIKLNKYHLIILATILLLASCKRNEQDKKHPSATGNEYTVKYAQGFSVTKSVDYTQIIVHDPWDTTKILQKYVLVDKSKQLPSKLPEGTLVRTPLSRVVAYTSVHCASLQELQSVDIIKGVCQPNYINLQSIKDGVANQSILDLGSEFTPNVERIIELNPEAILVAPVSGSSPGKIENLNIPIIQTPDYMEYTALGRGEWIRFYSLFIGKEALADSLFNVTEKNYNEIKTKIASVKERPVVLTDMMYQNVWYVPGGKSFIANMFHDAGASIPWNDNESNGSLNLSFEAVLDRAEKANIWLIKYNNPTDLTYQGLEKEKKGYSYFDAFKNKNVYGCNMGKITYYEDLPIHPDWILKDLAALFHPDLFSDYQLKYYKKID